MDENPLVHLSFHTTPKGVVYPSWSKLISKKGCKKMSRLALSWLLYIGELLLQKVFPNKNYKNGLHSNFISNRLFDQIP